MPHTKNKSVQPDNTPSFIRTQHAFTRYIRDPKNAPRPTDIEERRMNMYRDLLFTNISGVISDAFPVLKTISTEEHWEALCRDFFARHPSNSPYFSEISQEFLQFLQTERHESPDAKNDFPFMLELAHYEWAELYVAIAEDDNSEHVAVTDPLNQVLSIAHTALSLAYTFPVHTISPDVLPTEAPEQPTYLVVHRSADNRAGFLETTPMTHALLTALADNTALTTKALLTKLAADMQHPNADIVIEGGLSIVNDFLSRGIIVPV
ncbi:MAG: putative DNA-binding domain-containing protein [Cycloclasticus sp.]